MTAPAALPLWVRDYVGEGEGRVPVVVDISWSSRSVSWGQLTLLYSSRSLRKRRPLPPANLLLLCAASSLG